jgi:hypothetical protein
VATVDQVRGLVETNAPRVSLSVSNLAFFSERLSHFSGNLDTLLSTNTDAIMATLKSVETSAGLLKCLLEDLRAGKGTAGRLLADEQMSADVARIAQNLSITTSNLNRLGLWRLLWKPKLAASNRPPATARARAPHDPFD